MSKDPRKDIRGFNVTLDARTIEGYASVFNSESDDLGGFTEICMPGCFARSLSSINPDVRCLWNHNTNAPMGRVSAGNFEVREDDLGLFFKCFLPNTSYADDLIQLYTPMFEGKSPILYQNSFGFYIDEDDWEVRNDGSLLHIIHSAILDECSLGVCIPAYPQAISELLLSDKTIGGYRSKLVQYQNHQQSKKKLELYQYI